jgi:hypothetical protein
VETDLQWSGDYEVVWESKAGNTPTKVMTLPNDFSIVQHNAAPVIMRKFTLQDTDIFAFVPRYTDCHGLETYFFGVRDGKAFPISLEIKPGVSWTNISQLPNHPIKVSEGELIVIGGYGAGQDFVDVYHFRYDSKMKSLIMKNTEEVSPNEISENFSRSKAPDFSIKSGNRSIFPYFMDSLNWWIMSYDPLHTLMAYHTKDGGEHWTGGNETDITLGDGGVDVQFVDTRHGFVGVKIAGMCTSKEELLVTSDGGMTWARYPVPIRGKLSMLNNETGWLSGAWGCVKETQPDSMPFFKTTNGGKSWELVNLKLPSSVSDAGPMPVQIFDDGSAILPVYDEKQDLTLIYSISGDGRGWEMKGETHGYDPKFSDLLHGTIIETRDKGKVKLEKATTDGGKTWTIVSEK